MYSSFALLNVFVFFVGVAHLNNKKSQEAIAEEGAIELLLDRIWLTTRDESMQVA